MKHTFVATCALLAAWVGCEKAPTQTRPTVAGDRGSAARPATKPHDRIAEMIEIFKGHAKAVCACADLPPDRAVACTTAATDKYAQDFAKPGDAKPTPVEQDAFVEGTADATKQLGDCASRIVARAAATP